MVLVSCWGARRMSLPTERLRPSPTPATHSAPLTPPPAAVASFPRLSPAVRVGSTKKERAKSPLFSGAGDRTRTGTSVTSRDFKSLVSTYSTTPAYCLQSILTYFPLSVKRGKGKFCMLSPSFLPVFGGVFSDRRRNTFRRRPPAPFDSGSPRER